MARSNSAALAAKDGSLWLRLNACASQAAKRYGLDARDVLQDAQAAFWGKLGKVEPAGDEEESLFRGIIGNVAKRQRAEAGKHSAAGNRIERTAYSALAMSHGRDLVALRRSGKLELSRVWRFELAPMFSSRPAIVDWRESPLERRRWMLATCAYVFVEALACHEAEAEHGSADDEIATLYRGHEGDCEREVKRIAHGLFQRFSEAPINVDDLRLELCSLSRVAPSSLAELDAVRRRRIAEDVDEFLSEMRRAGEDPQRYTRRPGRPRKQAAPKTRKRRKSPTIPA